MERARLYLFIGRHIIGVAIFVWLTITCFQLKSASLGYLMAVMTPIYAGFAVYSGQKLLRRYHDLMEKYRAGGVRIAR
jgi:hypothetical protein